MHLILLHLLTVSLARTVTAFLFGFLLLTVLSVAAGVAMVVWSSRRVRRAGNGANLLIVYVVLVNLVVLAPVTAVMSFRYSLNIASARVIEAGGDHLAALIGRASDVAGSAFFDVFSKSMPDLRTFQALAEARCRAIERQLPGRILAEFDEQSVAADHVEAGLGVEKLSLVAEYALLRQAEGWIRESGATVVSTWQDFVVFAARRAQEGALRPFAAAARDFREAARANLQWLLIIHAAADGVGVGVVLATTRKRAPASA